VLDDDARAELCGVAVRLAESVGYDSLGTAEFLYDADTGGFYFLEVNARIQVEHPVTETVTGVDLVAEQIALAVGRELSIRQEDVTFTGHAIECRINAQVATGEGFTPSPGRITAWDPPADPAIRLDSHCHAGYLVPPYYDSLLGKIIARGATRDEARTTMLAALDAFVIEGIETTVPLHRAVLAHPDFIDDSLTTQWLDHTLPALVPAPA
jgi:acetyl-CoA carboxylase biotin carboxylase subunit